MKVAELIAQLGNVPPDAVVLILSSSGDPSLIDEVGQVNVQRQEWTRERHYQADGKSIDYHHPDSDRTLVFNVERDQAWQECVVILAPADENLELIFADRGAERDVIALRDELREQAMLARREMLRGGELVTESDLRARLGVSETTLRGWLEKGSVFGIPVDNIVAYPPFFCDHRINRKQLFKIARILVPAPPDARLDFLTTRSGFLGGKVPLKLLRKARHYRRIRQFATAWASEFSRTAVSFYDGHHEAIPLDVAPLYTSATEVDFRRPIWRRALKALTSFGYRWPHQVPSASRSFTFFIERHTAGRTDFEVEAFLHFSEVRDTAHVIVSKGATAPTAFDLHAVCDDRTVVDVARLVFELLVKRDG